MGAPQTAEIRATTWQNGPLSRATPLVENVRRPGEGGSPSPVVVPLIG